MRVAAVAAMSMLVSWQDPPAPEVQPARPKDAGASAQNAPIQNETNARWRDSVERGLEWLVRNQNADGSFGRGRISSNAGIVSLCALALMADGSLPGRGRHGAAVERALGYVLEHVTESGLVTSEGTNGPMYGHGFAALFLGEIYGMSPDDVRVRDALARAIRLIENSQNDEGGWRYNPVPDDADVSVTICQVMALRSARDGSGPAVQAYYFYGHYYATQAMYLAGGDWWKEWWPRIRSELIQHQDADGAWTDPQWGQALGTSMGLIIMQMPNRYLPIFQK
ncbi:MAG: hypothetical protein ACKO1V_12100 [Cyanobium sp.]